MSTLRDTALAWLATGERAVVVEVTHARGSVPRGAGTRMLVAEQRCAGTIGGGHLELKAILQARDMLATRHTTPQSAHYPLGPALGQCCGGAVTLGFSVLEPEAVAGWASVAPMFHVQLYGAGHVGRAIVRALAPLDVLVDWIDERAEAFPATSVEGGAAWPRHVRQVCVDTVQAEVRHAAAGAFYLVMTHEHDLDLRITEAILRRGDFGYLGLIGSRTKRQRFFHRFQQRGFADGVIGRITCPIGVPGITGNEPEVIAAAVVAQLLQVSHTTPRAGGPMRPRDTSVSI